MHPDDSMQKVINGKRYSVKTATLLASDEVWDGSNWERNGRNTFLYRTSKGAYFQVCLTMWQGERDTIVPLSRDEAMGLYEQLPEHNVKYELAFDAVVEEASLGRPSLYGEPLVRTALWLRQEQVDWLKAQDGTMAETVRKLIDSAMS